jgi:hypothetical protein
VHRIIKRLGEALFLPVDDYLAALGGCNISAGFTGIITAFIALVVSWWIYIPVHELFHALGCLLSGGEVTRLEISGVYGAALLKKVFPFVSAGSEYAGRLSGFDTHNSDVTYFLTVFFPYILTVFIGVPLLRSSVRSGASPLYTRIKFGASLPVAYAPFISVTGDYYEMGSIVVTKLLSLVVPDFQVDRWRSDDLFRLVDDLVISRGMVRAEDVAGIIVSLLLGVIMIFLTYLAGRLLAQRVLRV